MAACKHLFTDELVYRDALSSGSTYIYIYIYAAQAPAQVSRINKETCPACYIYIYIYMWRKLRRNIPFEASRVGSQLVKGSPKPKISQKANYCSESARRKCRRK